MRKRLFTRLPGDDEQLSRLLAPRLELAPAAVGRLVAAGSVWVNGRRVTADVKLAVGDKITVFSEPEPRAPQTPAFAIAYQDDWIVVVDKPAGLPSQGERAQSSRALDAQVQAALGPEARLIHRLDKEASGLVLFARRADACGPLQASLAAGAIERRYVAIVAGELTGPSEIRLRIGRHAHDSRLRAALPENAPAGQSAISRYRALGHGRLGTTVISAVELQLESGRTHQLRVHLAAVGHPIVGDEAYGGAAFERLCLHAARLELPHPRERKKVVVTSLLPPSFGQLVASLTSALA